MKRKLLPGVLVLCLAAGCQKKSDSEASEQEDQPGKQVASPQMIPRENGGEGADGDIVRNSYAEEQWPLSEEVENEWTKEFKEASTPEGKIGTVERKEASGPELLAPLIRLALRDPDERVRTESVKTLRSFAGVPRDVRDRVARAPSTPGPRSGPGPGTGPSNGIDNDPDPAAAPDESVDLEGEGPSDSSPPEGLDEVVDLVVGATHDPSSEVRILAMEAAVELLPDRQIEIYRRTIEVPDPVVRRMTITELGRIRSKPAFEVLITGLQHSDPAFREQVNTEINLLVNRRFESFEQASAWWGGSAETFSDNMIGIGGSR